jgi:hypothetical protein
MLAFLAPNDQPDAGGSSIAERHRWAGFGFHGLGIDAPIVDVRRTVETASGVRSYLGISALASGEQHH